MKPLRILLAVIVAIWLLGDGILSLLVDWNWFEAAGHIDLFSTKIWTQVTLWLSSFCFIFLFLFLNLRYSSSVAKINLLGLQKQLVDIEISIENTARLLSLLRWLAIIFPAFIFANIISDQWLYCLAFLEPVLFEQKDSLFGLDYSFFVFQLPMIVLFIAILKSISVLTMLIIGLQGFVRDVLLNVAGSTLKPKTRAHLAFLGSLVFLFFGVEWYLERYNILFTKDGVVWGAGYADVSARIPAYWIMTVVSVLVSLSLIFSLLRKEYRLSTTTIIGYFIARVLVVGIWPSIVQDYMVKPNELEVEKPFIRQNILATRYGYALDRISVEAFEASYDVTMKDIQNNPLTINNVRVWDDRPLLTTYGQLQEIRTYYDFKDVDIDRYQINGELRQVMLSARELNYRNVSSQAKSWVNEHFQYTHGYGLTMSPVNLVTEEGLPSLFIKDIPPENSINFEITRPEIYYGELTDSYVVVGGTVKEFDYPQGDQNVYSNYEGTGGVAIGSLWHKLLFAWHFGNIEMLLSNYIDSDSKILFRREITDRVETLAPFLYYDSDPYLVLSEGRMVWILDAYTITNDIPYSEPIGSNRFNYIRNSVKVVIDAYNGSVDFFVAEEGDPLIQVYQQIFPNTFKPLKDLPEDLKEHLRYPVDFFEIQAEMYRAYHMLDETVFYNKEDMWGLPKELYAGQEQRMEAYYLIMKLPEAEEAEFVLLLPFVPTGKDNMISWLAARSDAPNYGRLILYQFPKQKLIYGPRQIEARIDQDPEISKQITLWSQSGSSVVRGNLLVIPIGNSLVYVEPLYLQAESSQLPELKRVIVAYDNRIAMEKTLSESLLAVFGDKLEVLEKNLLQKEDSERRLSSIDSSMQNDGWEGLAQKAYLQLQEATQAQREGNWSVYGQRLEDLAQSLEDLKSLTEETAEKQDFLEENEEREEMKEQ